MNTQPPTEAPDADTAGPSSDAQHLDTSTTPLAPLATPRVVAEDLSHHTRRYWVRSQDGSYFVARRSEACLNMRLARKPWDSLEAFPVEFIAGLPPGIHERKSTRVLVPRSTPFASPSPQAPMPPAEFSRIAADLARLIKSGGDPDAICDIRKKVAQIYERQVGVRLPWDKARAWGLLGLKQPLGPFPCDDHCAMYSGPRGLVWTSQPYHVEEAALVGFAAWHGLSVSVSREWSWYYPTRSYLIEWRRIPGSMLPTGYKPDRRAYD